MPKLESLADRPANKDDVGKIIYFVVGLKSQDETIFDIKECQGHFSTGINEYPLDTPYAYWSKPVVISESEYDELKEKAWKYDDLCK
jgi:hypothetical protein